MRRLAPLLLLLALPASAQPILKVRSRARIELESVRRRPRDASKVELELRGRLVDADVGVGIDRGTVAIDIEGPNGFYKIAVPTRDDGGFEVHPPLKPGEYQLRIHGSRADDPEHLLYDAAQPIERTLNLARTTPTIRLHAADEASVAQTALHVEIDTVDPGDDDAASSTAPLQPIELPVGVFVGAEHVTDTVTHGGHAAIELPPSAMGRPGATVVVTVRFDGDALRNPAEASHRVRLTTPTQLTLSASSTELPSRGSVDLTGELTDWAGPVGGASIELAAAPDGRVLAGTTTDGKGRFRVALEGGHEKPGTLFVEARFGSGPSFREPSRSAAVALTVLQPQPRPLGFWLSPLATALAIGGAMAWRKKPWRTLAARSATVLKRNRPAPTTGLTENRPRLLSALRPANDHGLSGQVVELPSMHGVPTATVTITAGDVPRVLAVDEEGRFAVEDLPAGPVLVEVTAPGYVPERFRRAVPHRGELRAARVTLVPIRERIFAAYKAVALPFLPEARLAETWTPRELVRHVARRRLIVDDLDAFTRLVEVACFGPRLPDASVLAEAERLAAQVGRSP
jgi:hypothetical protein